VVVSRIDGVLPAPAAGSFAAQRRRESRREEWGEQMKLTAMLNKYLNLGCTFWTSLENKPISRISGIFQKKRGVRSGIADVFVLYSGRPIFVELKSRAGVATKAQKQVRVELLSAGATWWMARSARGAMMACTSQAWSSAANGSHRGCDRGKDRSRTRRGGCRRRRTWPHGDGPHDDDGGYVRRTRARPQTMREKEMSLFGRRNAKPRAKIGKGL
jgi:hypothetical protein